MQIPNKIPFVLIFTVLGFSVLILSLIRASIDTSKMGSNEGQIYSIEFQERQDNNLIVSNYSFPYPGILPGSPFYFLKKVRNSCWLFLTMEPLDKAEIELMMADKDVASAIMLKGEQKDKLASSSFSEAQNFLKKSYQDAQKIENQIEKKLLLQKLKDAAKAHQTVALEHDFDISPIYKQIMETEL
jgi:hypothetical protein